jgi:hypothetical protein
MMMVMMMATMMMVMKQFVSHRHEMSCCELFVSVVSYTILLVHSLPFYTYSVSLIQICLHRAVSRL